MALTERRIENSTVWIHLNYPAKKNPLRYRFYRSGCGRDRTLKKIWGDAAGGH